MRGVGNSGCCTFNVGAAFVGDLGGSQSVGKKGRLAGSDNELVLELALYLPRALWSLVAVALPYLPGPNKAEGCAKDSKLRRERSRAILLHCAASLHYQSDSNQAGVSVSSFLRLLFLFC